MPSDRFLTPRRRDALGVLLALVLLTGPVWAPALHLDDPTYRYERARVTVDGSGVAFANESAVPAATALSEEIACTGHPSRACTFERYLARNHTVRTEIYSTSPDEQADAIGVGPAEYDFVRIDGTVYETTTLGNRSQVYVVANGTVYEKGEAPEDVGTSGDLYRLELSLRRVEPGEALADVSRDVESVPDPIGRAARTGVGIAHRDLDVPETPIRTGEDTYYRVYLASQRQSVGETAWIETVLVFGGPVAGLATLARLRHRVEITYTPGRE